MLTPYVVRPFSSATVAGGPSGRVDYVAPGKPMQNGLVESLNGRFRDECLTMAKNYMSAAQGDRGSRAGRGEPLAQQMAKLRRRMKPIIRHGDAHGSGQAIVTFPPPISRTHLAIVRRIPTLQ